MSKFISNLAFLVLLLCGSGNAIAQSSIEKLDLANTPKEQTCGREYTRWEVLFVLGKIYEKTDIKDWQGAIDEAAAFDNVDLTCSELYYLHFDLASVFAGAGDIPSAIAYLDALIGFKGLEHYQEKSLKNFKERLLSEEWEFKTSNESKAENEADLKANAPDRAPVEIKKPNISHFKSVMKKYKRYGVVLCDA